MLFSLYVLEKDVLKTVKEIETINEDLKRTHYTGHISPQEALKKEKHEKLKMQVAALNAHAEKSNAPFRYKIEGDRAVKVPHNVSKAA